MRFTGCGGMGSLFFLLNFEIIIVKTRVDILKFCFPPLYSLFSSSIFGKGPIAKPPSPSLLLSPSRSSRVILTKVPKALSPRSLKEGTAA